MTNLKPPKLQVVNYLLVMSITAIVLACSEDNIAPDRVVSINDQPTAVGDAVSITNAGFESSWSGWNDTDPSSISSDANSGSKSAKITGSGGKLEQTVSVKANTEYSLSAYVLGSWRIGVNVSGTRKTRSGNASSWKKETVTFSSGSATSVTILAEYKSAVGRFDDFELIEGTSTDGSGDGGGNLALSGTATQSSTGYSGVASRAIDGNTSGVWSQGSVTHTANSDSSPWWQVDLGVSKNIGDIKIFNRTNCCSNRLTYFTVFVINSSGSTTFSKTYTSYPNPSVTVDAGGALGKIVRIQLNENNRLSLAEVEVYEGESTPPDPTNYTSIPAKIEAEDYDDATEGRTETKGSITNVGWIDNGEYLSYNVNVPNSGTYTVDFNVASLSNTIKFDIYQGNSKVGNISHSTTGGWSNWVTTSTDVQLSSGDQTIKLIATGSGWNINWLEFKTSNDPDPDPDPGTANIPSDLMENCNQWKITYPDGSEDKTLCGEGNNEYYYVNDDKNAIVFRVPIRSDNGSTPNSNNIRSELRERKPDGSSDEYWTTDNKHVVYAKQAITHLPIVVDHLVATQIHGNKADGIDDAMVLRLEGSHLYLAFNGRATTSERLRDPVTIKTNYSLGTVHEVIFEVIDGKHYCYYSEDGNLASAYQNGNANSYLVKDGGNDYVMDLNYDQSYFKVGNYTQSNADDEGSYTDDPNNYGEVLVYDFWVKHTPAL